MSHCFICIHQKDCKEDMFNCPFYHPKDCDTCKYEYKPIIAEPCYHCNKFYSNWEACHE